MRRAFFFIFLLSGLVLPRAFAFREPDVPSLPDFDKRHPDKVKAVAPEKNEALGRLQKKLPSVKAEFDGITGSPRFISAKDGFLTGRGGKGRALAAAGAAPFPANDRHAVTKAFIKEHKELFGHGPDVLADAHVKRDATAAHNGLKTTVWEQQLDGIPVFDALIVSHVTKDEELVNISSHFVPDLAAVDVGAKNRAELSANPPVSARKAIVAAARNIGDDVLEDSVESLTEDSKSPAEKRKKYKTENLPGEIDAKLVWLPLDEKRLRLCWEISLTSKVRGEGFRILVDAETGEVLVRHNLTRHLSDASYRVFTSDSPSPLSPGHPFPTNTQPPVVSRVLVTTNAVNTTASPNGWIDDGVNETRGNNVDAQTDRNASNTADEARPEGSPNRVFDFDLNFSQSPLTSSNSAAAVVQLFYWCNWAHDRFYELGFTEEVGNFQNDNFGRGGEGDDALQADAQDGRSVNNASFTTDSDGIAGRVEMFLFNGPEPDRDGTLDVEVILHELTHGLSERLVGSGALMRQLQSKGMGEGWSDFYALTFLSESNDDTNGTYAIGAYSTYQRTAGHEQNYYFGIRRYPYSIDLTKNPLTFKDIDPFQAAAHPGVPRNPGVGSWIDSAAAEVHNQGEVWCSMLWEARAKLISKYGFTNGTQTILQLVTDGMKLCPRDPTFVQARDAIFAADRVNNPVGNLSANYHELWAAFARRGLGFFASAPPSTITTGVIESFALPDDLFISPDLVFISRGEVGGPFSPDNQTYIITNIGTNTLLWTLQESAAWLDVSTTNGTFGAGSGTNVTFSINTSIASALAAGIYTENVSITNLTSGVVQTRQFVLRVGQPDFFSELFEAKDFDLQNTSFTFTPDGSVSFYSVCRTNATSFPTDPAGGTVLNLVDDSFLPVILTNNVSVYDKSTNSFFIGSNGYITFDSGDIAYAEDFSWHMNQPRISGLFHDFDPTSNGTVSWKQLSNRVAVTFFHVPTYGSTNTNDFQIEMFYDGRIRLTYLQVKTRLGLVGLSPGEGLSETFLESDFSSFIECAPSLVVELPQNFAEGDGLLDGIGTVRIPSPLATNLAVTFYSTDYAEAIASPTIILAGQTSASFDLEIIDDADLDGTQSAMITAIASGYQNGRATISVFDNENASLVVDFFDVSEEFGSAVGTITVSEATDADVVVNLSSSDLSEIQVPSMVTILAGEDSASFVATIINDNEIDGHQNVTLTAHVQNWQDGVTNFLVFDDEHTNLTLVLLEKVREGNGYLTNAGLVSISGTLSSNLVVTLESDTASEASVPVSVVIAAGETSAPLDLTVYDDELLDGNQSVNVSASASGFFGAMHQLTVYDDETPLPPTQPFPPHLSLNNSVAVNLAWSPGIGDENRPTTYDIYFGTNTLPDTAEFLGSTTNTTWDLPVLEPFTFYYWQVVARRLGETNSPVWQFRTAPNVSISNASVVEGNSATTNITFILTLASPSSEIVTVDFMTADGSATAPSDYVAKEGTVTFDPGETNAMLTVEVNGETIHETNETLFVILTNSVNCAIENGQATGTIVNEDPFLSVISDKTVNEGSLLTFSPQTGAAGSPAVKTVTTFETYTNTGNGAVMFRPPRESGSTSQYLSASPNVSLVTNVFPSGHSGSKVLQASWSFNGAANQWLRLITGQTGSQPNPLLPNPTIDFNQVVQFDIYTDRPLRIGLGIRETSTTNLIGDDGGSTGAIEFAGVTNKINSMPQPTRTLAAGAWQTVSFFLPYEAVTSFSGGNGVLDSSTGKGVLEHIALVPLTNSANGTFNIYLDNFSVIYSNVLTFALSNAPPGASINATNGIFTWTPTEAQGPGIYTMRISVTDNNTIFSSQTFSVTVNEVNVSPVLTALPNRNVNELTMLTFTNSAADSDIPANTLSYTLDPGAPAGATVNPTNGVFTWMPTETQGPGTYLLAVRVTDNGSPMLDASRTFSVTVNEVNTAPALSPIPDQLVYVGTPISFLASASDSDIPENEFIFDSIDSLPAGASFHPATGLFQWTPQTPGTNVINLRVTDSGSPALTGAETFTVTVAGPPQIQQIDVTENEVTLTWTALPGKNYRLQYRTEFNESDWFDVEGDITADGPLAFKADFFFDSLRFYRVKVLP